MHGKKNIVIGLFIMAGFMLYGFLLIYLRDFAPNAAEWAAAYGNGKHFVMELLLKAPPYFVLVGAVSMTASVFLLGLFVSKSKKVMGGEV